MRHSCAYIPRSHSSWRLRFRLCSRSPHPRRWRKLRARVSLVGVLYSSIYRRFRDGLRLTTRLPGGVVRDRFRCARQSQENFSYAAERRRRGRRVLERGDIGGRGAAEAVDYAGVVWWIMMMKGARRL